MDFALMPFENTLGGSIHANYDLMMRHPLFVVAETQLRVRHCLLANQGVTKGDIQKVMSHPQALAQCDNYIRNNGWMPEAFHDTAASGQKILEERSIPTAMPISSKPSSRFPNFTFLPLA